MEVHMNHYRNKSRNARGAVGAALFAVLVVGGMAFSSASGAATLSGEQGVDIQRSSMNHSTGPGVILVADDQSIIDDAANYVSETVNGALALGEELI
jgi:hypothetical protein